MQSSLREDPLLQRVLRNSSYLFSSNMISAALGVLQGIFVLRLLGGSGYGLLTIVMDFASNTNRLLSFRMSEVVVKYMGGGPGTGGQRTCRGARQRNRAFRSRDVCAGLPCFTCPLCLGGAGTSG